MALTAHWAWFDVGPIIILHWSSALNNWPGKEVLKYEVSTTAFTGTLARQLNAVLSGLNREMKKNKSFKIFFKTNLPGIVQQI